MLEDDPDSFEGGMSAKNMAITKTSRATATQDLQDLAKMGVLVSEGGGHSLRYKVRLD